MVLVHFRSARGTLVFLTRSFTRLSCLQSDNEEKVENFASRSRFFIHESLMAWLLESFSVRPNQIASFEFRFNLSHLRLPRKGLQ